MLLIPLLLWIIIATSVMTFISALRTPGGPRGVYLVMLVAEVFMAGMVLERGLFESPAVIVVMLAYVLLVPLPSILGSAIRRAVTSDRFSIAAKMASLREWLQPSVHTRFEREQLDAIVAVHAGRGDETIEDLRRASVAAEDPVTKRLLAEQLLSLLIVDRRFGEALSHYEKIGGARLSPPLSPVVHVQMIRAAVETDDMVFAADLVFELERSPIADRPEAVQLIAQARLFFLAGAGRTADVIEIMDRTNTPSWEPAKPLGDMPERAKLYWTGIATARAGDAAGAERLFAQCEQASLEDKKGQKLATLRKTEVAQGLGVGPSDIPEGVLRLVETISERAKAARQPRVLSQPRRVPVTVVLVALNLLIFGLLELIGSTTDPSTLVAAGANVRRLVEMGDYWRLPSSMFLHIGLIHVALNCWSLWVLGRLIEPRFGALRYWAVYVGAGLGGAVASTLHAAAPISAGASGAIFGLLGGSISLFWRDKTLPDPMRRALLSNLAFLAALNIALGLVVKELDQAAHVGGFVTGGIVALAVGRAQDSRAWTSLVAKVVAALGAGIVVWGFVFGVNGVLHRDRTVSVEMNGAVMDVPWTWSALTKDDEGNIFDPEGSGTMRVALFGASSQNGVTSDAPPISLSAAAEKTLSLSTVASGGKRVETQPTVQLVPPGANWMQREMVVHNGGGAGKLLRDVLVLRQLDDGRVLVWMFTQTEDRLKESADRLRKIVSSLRVAP